MLGPHGPEILAKAFTEPGNDYSYENTILAERNERIVGMASAFPAEARAGFSDQVLKRAAGKHTLRMTVVGWIVAPLMRILKTLPDDAYYLLAVAVDREARGSGVGSMLLDAIENRAKANESGRLALDVSARNENAGRLYARRGMSVVSKWPNLPFVPALFVRMIKTL